MRSKILLFVFIPVALIQLYVPANMILERNDILKTGSEFRFRTAPIDPYDPFRGSYVWLNFKDDSFLVEDTTTNWERGQPVFLEFDKDKHGFAKIRSVRRQKPVNSEEFLETTIRYVSENPRTIQVEYPFDRLYMEESKAYPAEQAYTEASRDTSVVTYAIVHIKEGDAVLKDVHIDGVSIREVARKRLNK